IISIYQVFKAYCTELDPDYQVNMSSKSPKNLTPLGESSSQEPKSTTPIALRTRRCATQITFLKAAHLKECKICNSSFKSISKLRAHVLNHKPNTKRRKAIEAIDQILKETNPVQPTPTTTVSKKGAAPTKLFSRFAKVFPELFAEESTHEKRPLISSLTTTSPKPVKKDTGMPDSSSTPADLQLSSEISSCMNDLLESVVHSQVSKSILLPVISTLTELEDDLQLSSSSSSDSSITEILQTSTPLSAENTIQSVSTSPPKKNISQVQGSSGLLSINHELTKKDSPGNLPNSPNPNSRVDNDISILDIILSHSQESLDTDFVSLPTPPKTSSTNSVPSNIQIPASPNHFASAALEGQCLICSQALPTSDLLQHLYRHKPGPLRAKCLAGFRSSFPPHSLPKKINSSSPPPPISTIEMTFRTNFPELPVFQQDLNSSSSSDEEYLFNKLPSPPTGPPKVSPFKKALFSRIVKNGLYRCDYCEKSFITEAGANKHRLQIHHIPPHVTKARFMPDCSPEMCRVCFKGPAPYKSIAEHYKYKHNLEISTNSESSSSNTIVISSKDFVSTKKKHIRNILPIPSSSIQAVNTYNPKQMSPPEAKSTVPKSYSEAISTNIQGSSSNSIFNPVIKSNLLPKSQGTKNSQNLTIVSNLPKFKHQSPNLSSPDSPAIASSIQQSSHCHISLQKKQETRVFHNLKIVARPELGGLGPSKLISYPASRLSSISKASSSKPNPISVTAEVYHANSSQDPRLRSSPRKCSLCPFIAIKYCGLRLHYFKEHNLRKIPTAPQSASTIPPGTLSSEITSIRSKPATLPQVSSLHSYQSSNSSLSSANGKEIKSLSLANNSSTASPPSKKAPITAPRTSYPVIASSSSMEQFNSSVFSVLPSKNAVTSQHPVVTTQPPSPIVPFVSFDGSTLQYSFPISTRLKCPIEGCNASFGTKSWHTTNTSIKKHLHIFHKQKPSKINYHCSVCNSSIAKNPAKHSCLINNLILHPAVIEGDHWVCEICECFSASTKIAKKNHLDAHAREVITANSSQLIIPPNSKAKRKTFNKRIKDLSEGPAGNLPLAPPIADAIESENPPAIEIENITKIDLDNVSILASFAEPLDAIFEVDDLEEAQVAFEILLHDIISVMQNHFHLAPSNDSRKAPPSNSSTRVKSDSQNAQLIQRQYRWNRRKCVRNIVNPSSSFCQIEKNLLHSHFTETWAPPSDHHTFPDSSPPTLPPVLELLHSDAIASCLQSCENSAPGPDRLSYQHWKSIDPRCVIISKIFNICIKFKDVPSSWKHSTCILIPKKGDASSIHNWRPITLSNSIYKLFSKCLARRLQDGWDA
ncbi:c2H2-type domain-containing protein, partial [Nephila pilipes]